MRSISLLLLCYIGIPFAASFLGIFLGETVSEYGNYLILAIFAISGLIAGYFIGKGKKEAATFQKRYLPVYLPLLLTVSVAAILMLLTKGYFGNGLWNAFIFLEFPFLPNSFISAFMGEFLLVFLAPFTYFTALLLGFTTSERKSSHKVTFQKKTVILAFTTVLICLAVSSFVFWQRSQTILPFNGFTNDNRYSDIDLSPYTITNEKNILPTLKDASTFKIFNKQDMPILDGATAAYPVYAAFAKAVYKNIEHNNLTDNGFEIVNITTTINAFERLVSGDVDIFFGAQPSAEQKRLAEQSGKELVLTPIGKEAFVFFVNKKNPVNELTTQQIKDIYSGKITNWEQVNGENNKIRAFQRPENSGSQTIMEKFMGDTPLMDPLKEEISGMGEIMEEAANYRNYKTAIGYSFRFFTTGMNPNNEIKLIPINGIEPSTENIQSGKYPYVVNLYAITLKDNPKTTINPFLKWMQGEQGQKLVEDIGYVPLK
ncbi:MAG TPA: substrate-binding domain-containing protein [Bacillales bacterium]|nr:substrate-binding domain-containing protein [Bacillales bacterium]